MIVGGSRGVSKSSTAMSSLLVLLLPTSPCLQVSAWACARRLYEEEVRDRGSGLEGGGIYILALSELASVVPGSAYRPFLLENEVMLEADDRLCEFFRAFDLELSEESRLFWAVSTTGWLVSLVKIVLELLSNRSMAGLRKKKVVPIEDTLSTPSLPIVKTVFPSFLSGISKVYQICRYLLVHGST